MKHIKQWVDRDGNNLDHGQVREFLRKSIGSETAADHCRVGQVYENGGLWFQRID